MKQSHLTTPRSLSECSFTPGYVCGEPKRSRWWHVAITLGIFAGIGVMMAWRG